MAASLWLVRPDTHGLAGKSRLGVPHTHQGKQQQGCQHDPRQPGVPGEHDGEQARSKCVRHRPGQIEHRDVSATKRVGSGLDDQGVDHAGVDHHGDGIQDRDAGQVRDDGLAGQQRCTPRTRRSPPRAVRSASGRGSADGAQADAPSWSVRPLAAQCRRHETLREPRGRAEHLDCIDREADQDHRPCDTEHQVACDDPAIGPISQDRPEAFGPLRRTMPL